jgi:hypothetical protein
MTITPEQRKQFLEEVQTFKEQEAQKELDQAKPTVLVGKTIAFDPMKPWPNGFKTSPEGAIVAMSRQELRESYERQRDRAIAALVKLDEEDEQPK